MARPRTFDTDRVLADVRDAFWAGGVSATGIGDLCAATGLTTGSLYKAFDSKPALVRRVLDDYLAAGLVWTEALLDGAPEPLDGIRLWLEGVADAAASDSPTRGCFAVQCAAELAETEPDVRERIVRHDAALRALVTDRFARAAAAGAFGGNPDAQARLVLTVVNGLQLEARKGIALADARALVDTLMATLPRAPVDGRFRGPD